MSDNEGRINRTSSSGVHGSLANLLPLIDGEENEVKEPVSSPSALLVDRNRTYSDLSIISESEIDDFKFTGLSGRKDAGSITPGDIRTAVLEWMYEEKDELACPELAIENCGILEDLITVFVSVVLHGKSDVVRTQVWRFLVQGATNSLHFAFLVICNLNASSFQEESSSEGLNTEYKKKLDQDLAAIEKVVGTLKKESLLYVSKLKQTDPNPKIIELESSLGKALKQLEDVHDNQVLTNLDVNVRGRTSRQNIDMLVQKIRNSLIGDPTKTTSAALKELDGKIGFIKTLTDLDDWLMRSVPREERKDVLAKELQKLSIALPLGAYFPTAVDSGATQQHRVLRLVIEETIVFNTARKCPFLLVAEVETLRDEVERTSKSPRSSNQIALEAFEMVSTKKFWKDPVQSIRDFKQQKGGGDAEEHLKAPFKKPDQEKWQDQMQRVRKDSPFGERPNWQLAAMFVKSGDDLRQQQLGLMFVTTFQKIFLEEGVSVWLAPYKVIATGRTSGLLEPARNADSIARIKERGGYEGIDEYFVDTFGAKTSSKYKRAQRNFIQSLAGYSIVAYLIKLHDRHNGNILIDTDGHLLHIDFGFMLGYSHKLERSPFKLTPDMVAILGGPYSPTFQSFRRLMEKAYVAANKHHKEIVLLAELMSSGSSSSECFAGGRRWVIDELRGRFNPGLSTRKLRGHINDIIDASLGNYTTRCYDKYQRCVNGIW